MYLNGILADDMGLGKTLQTLAVLQKRVENKENIIGVVIIPAKGASLDINGGQAVEN